MKGIFNPDAISYPPPPNELLLIIELDLAGQLNEENLKNGMVKHMKQWENEISEIIKNRDD